MTKLFIDIETIPCQWPNATEEIKRDLKAPANYTKQETIDKWIEENAEKAYLKTSFDGGMGQIVVIGYAIDDHPAQTFQVSDLSIGSEKEILEDLYQIYSEVGAGSLVIGHNHIGFDLPFVFKRSIINSVTPTPFFPRNPKWNGAEVYDTMLGWSGKEFTSMNTLCKLFGIDGKGDIDGSDVWPMVQAGKITEVAQYCAGDVERTREIFKRLTFGQL